MRLSVGLEVGYIQNNMEISVHYLAILIDLCCLPSMVRLLTVQSARGAFQFGCIHNMEISGNCLAIIRFSGIHEECMRYSALHDLSRQYHSTSYAIALINFSIYGY